MTPITAYILGALIGFITGVFSILGLGLFLYMWEEEKEPGSGEGQFPHAGSQPERSQVKEPETIEYMNSVPSVFSEDQMKEKE